jgi:hypothetical protein
MYRAQLDLGFDTIDMTAATVRKLTVYALVAYPVGTLLRVQYGADAFVGGVLGGLLAFSALFVGFAIFGTRFYKVVTPANGPLDEYQLSLRHAAMVTAYSSLSSLLFALFFYAYFAIEFGLWLPDSSEAWQQIAFGLSLLVLILPTATLVWSGNVDDHADEGVEA